MPYLTGDEPDGECSVSIIIPNDARIRQALVGAISELSYPHMWEQFGDLSAGDTASLMLASFSTLQIECIGEQPIMIVSAHRTTAMTVTSNVAAKLTALNVVPFDTGQWDAGNNWVLIDSDGLYIAAIFAASGIANSGLLSEIRVNSSGVVGERIPPFSGLTAQTSSLMPLALLEGDVVEFWVTVNGGTSLATLFNRLGFLIYRLGNLA
jgi:hypothetical protein